MSTHPVNPSMPVQPAPDALAPDLALLLAEPFTTAWSTPVAADGPLAALRERLGHRLVATRRAEAGFTTVRRRRAPRQALGEGVSAQTLYRAADTDPAAAPGGGRGLRPGEPVRATLIELAAGARFEADGRLGGSADCGSDGLGAVALHREWLLLAGSATVDGCVSAQALSQRDYLVVPAGHGPVAWSSEAGALLFLRESTQPAAPGEAPSVVLDAVAGWPEFVPGIRRRVLWQRDGQAALLYHAEPGAQVPLHRHGHDEECLMLQGELFLDDLLLQAGDYQLAPAGSSHRITETDTGVVIYAHGDLDLQFVG